jgi:C4-dicarboxylate-specific signal transduction histidine kinase/ActR/RegA family two-component response regulator
MGRKMILNNRQFVSRIVIGAVIINLIVFGLTAYSIHTSKNHYEDQARTEAENLTRSLEFSISGILDNVALALWTEKAEAERQLTSGGIKKPAFDTHIANTLKKVPEMANLRMADAKGDILYGVEAGSGPVANIADRDYFTALRDDSKSELFISKPILGRISKKWIIIIARRVDNPDGSFAGVIHGNIPIDIIKKQFASFDLGKHGMFTLRDKELSIVARHPETEKSTPGKQSISKEFIQMIKAGQMTGSYRMSSKVDGISRVISYRKLDIYPLYVNCGIASQDYLAAWYRDVGKQLVLVLLFTLFTLAGARFIVQSWKQKQLVLDDLSTARDDLELRVAERTEELQIINENLMEQRSQLQDEISNRQIAQKELADKNVQLEQEISIRKHAEEERNQLESKMQQTQKLESLGVLAGGIAHDFNNILLAIIGNADLALMKLNPESPAKDNLQKIEQAAARAAELSKQMLAYSGKGKFIVESLNLNRLLEEMLHMLEVSISKKAVIRLNLNNPLPSVEADATQMRQIFMNLVINASEAIGDKSGVIAITTGCMDCNQNYLKDVWLDDNISEGLYVYVEVADTGCGMDQATLEKIFDPFFTTKFTGRGLGMSAVLGIIRGHKGAIKVYSEPGKGSNFKILLPASEKPAELFNVELSKNDWKGSGKVLLVDDEETVRGVGTEMLKELGFDVLTACDGRDALEVFKKNLDTRFVILDLTMPHMDGEQCFRELHQVKPGVKVIMSSGFNEQEVTQKFVGKGLAGFIQKPYKLSVLRDAIMKMDLNVKGATA